MIQNSIKSSRTWQNNFNSQLFRTDFYEDSYNLSLLNIFTLRRKFKFSTLLKNLNFKIRFKQPRLWNESKYWIILEIKDLRLTNENEKKFVEVVARSRICL